MFKSCGLLCILTFKLTQDVTSLKLAVKIKNLVPFTLSAADKRINGKLAQHAHNGSHIKPC